jgi:hypothetical protein
MVATFVAVAPERRSVGIGRALTQQNVHALVVQGALNARARMAQDEDTAAKMEDKFALPISINYLEKSWGARSTS